MMNEPVRFAQISDTHVRPDAVERGLVLADHLAEIQAGGYDFVIHTGDLMDEPSAWAARAFRAMVSRLQIPVYFVPGNHDVYNPPMGEIEAPWWARLEVDSDTERQYRDWFGPSWHIVGCRGVHLVGFDSLIINSGLPEEAEQWIWLEETLRSLGGRGEQIVLFTHLPLFIRQPDEELDAADFANRDLVIAPPGRDRLLDLIRQHRVTAVLSGHIHVPWARSHTWPEGFTTRFVSTGTSGKPSGKAIEQFDLREHKLIISSSYAVAKGVLNSSDQLHICYCHSPMRYIWDLTFEYLEAAGLSGGLKSFLVRMMLHYIRLWDVTSANRVNEYIANSHYIAHRIWKCYNRPAKVIYPPVDVDRF